MNSAAPATMPAAIPIGPDRRRQAGTNSRPARGASPKRVGCRRRSPPLRRSGSLRSRSLAPRFHAAGWRPACRWEFRAPSANVSAGSASTKRRTSRHSRLHCQEITHDPFDFTPEITHDPFDFTLFSLFWTAVFTPWMSVNSRDFRANNQGATAGTGFCRDRPG
jgi:hypothetical protein